MRQPSAKHTKPHPQLLFIAKQQSNRLAACDTAIDLDLDNLSLNDLRLFFDTNSYALAESLLQGLGLARICDEI